MEALKPTKARFPYLPNTLFLNPIFSAPPSNLNHFPVVPKLKESSRFKSSLILPHLQAEDTFKTSKKIVLSEVTPRHSGRGMRCSRWKWEVSSKVREWRWCDGAVEVLEILSNLPLAIGEMSTLAGLMALGTVIDQGEAPDYYFQKYPEGNPLLEFGIRHLEMGSHSWV